MKILAEKSQKRFSKATKDSVRAKTGNKGKLQENIGRRTERKKAKNKV